MQLLPEDLGQWRLIALAHIRLLSMQGVGGRSARRHMSPVMPANLVSIIAPQGLMEKEPKQGFWERVYTGGLGLKPPVADAVFDAIKPALGGILGGVVGGFGGGFGTNAVWMLASGEPGLQILGSVFGVAAVTGIAAGMMMPRYLVRKFAKSPLTQPEIAYLIQCAGENQLMKDYLSLAQEAMQQSNLPEQSENNLREAIRALGEAIDRLPETPLTIQDANRLEQEMRQAQANLLQETDPVVRASQERRLMALESSLKSSERSNVVSRRARALREEIAAQIESVRLGMASLHDGGQETGAHFGEIADSVRRVATEAGSVADARNEMDSFLTRTIPVEEPAILRIRQ